jgi:hypothetical protein
MFGSKYYNVHHVNILKEIFFFEYFFFHFFSFLIIDNHPKNNVALNGNQYLSTCPKNRKYFYNLCTITINRSVVNLAQNYLFFSRIV